MATIERKEKDGAKIYNISKDNNPNNTTQRIIICKAKDIKKHI